jgi:hypothetical protein
MNVNIFFICKSQYFTNKQCEKVTCPIGQVQLEIDLSDHKMDWTRTIEQMLMLSSVPVLFIRTTYKISAKHVYQATSESSYEGKDEGRCSECLLGVSFFCKIFYRKPVIFKLLVSTLIYCFHDPKSRTWTLLKNWLVRFLISLP